MEEPFIPYFRIVLLMIVFVCMIAVYQAISASDGIIATNLNEIVSMFFNNAKANIPAIPTT